MTKLDGRWIGPLIPCYVGALSPEVGIATLEFLEPLGGKTGTPRQPSDSLASASNP